MLLARARAVSTVKPCARASIASTRATKRAPGATRGREIIGAAGSRRIQFDDAHARAVATRASTANGNDWEDLFDAFERQGAAQRIRESIPRVKARALERALARGRRRVEVGKLCKELELDRSDVLAWLKANGHRAEELAVTYAEEIRLEADESAQREARLEREREERARREREREEKGKNLGPGGMPAYKSYKKTRLGASNLATLEKVYALTQYPDDAMLESVRQATKLPTSKIITWFKERRGGNRRVSPSSPQSAGDQRVERKGTTGGYSYTRREDADDRKSGLRRGDTRDEYGGGGRGRPGRDSASNWSPN